MANSLACALVLILKSSVVFSVPSNCLVMVIMILDLYKSR